MKRSERRTQRVEHVAKFLFNRYKFGQYSASIPPLDVIRFIIGTLRFDLHFDPLHWVCSSILIEWVNSSMLAIPEILYNDKLVLPHV